MSQLTNKEMAVILKELADLMEITGENKYRIQAYANASRKIMNLKEELQELIEEERLEKMQGIGRGIATLIKETYQLGYCPPLEEIKAKLPDGVLDLIKIPGLGPKKAHKLFYELGIKNIAGLKEALKTGEIKKVKGFGPKSTEKLRQSLAVYENYQGTVILSKALKQAEEIVAELKKCSYIQQIEVAGSIRRRKELIRKIDIVLGSAEPERVMEYFLQLPLAAKILARNKSRLSVLTEDKIPLELIMVTAEEFPAALQYFTGSREHNLKLCALAKKKGFNLTESGLFKNDKRIQLQTEADIYYNLGMQYIIPELREDRGEIEAALENRLPTSVTLSDIKGDLHLHTRYSDGAYSLVEMIEAARNKGYQYLAITDHSQSLKVANGLTPAELVEQMREIDKIQQKYPGFKILKGIEVDILPDGSLDYEDELLAQLDLVIASIHTGFNQSKEQLTKRMVKAMQNPLVKIIAHPQGRILKKRPPYQLDLKRVIAVAVQTGTCLEINASPYRLDLNDLAVREAQRAGVKIAISTDSHHLQELDDMALGVAVARRAWLSKEDVLNTMSQAELLKFLRGDGDGR